MPVECFIGLRCDICNCVMGDYLEKGARRQWYFKINCGVGHQGLLSSHGVNCVWDKEDMIAGKWNWVDGNVICHICSKVPIEDLQETIKRARNGRVRAD